MSEAREAVAEVLQLYFDGLFHSDVERLSRALHAKAIYATATGDELVYHTLDEYLPIVAARPSPASREEPRQDQIESIQFAGDSHAFARLRCAIGEKQYVDLLSLVLDQGRWQIIAKVFHYELKA